MFAWRLGTEVLDGDKSWPIFFLGGWDSRIRLAKKSGDLEEEQELANQAFPWLAEEAADYEGTDYRAVVVAKWFEQQSCNQEAPSSNPPGARVFSLLLLLSTAQCP